MNILVNHQDGVHQDQFDAVYAPLVQTPKHVSLIHTVGTGRTNKYIKVTSKHDLFNPKFTRNTLIKRPLPTPVLSMNNKKSRATLDDFCSRANDERVEPTNKLGNYITQNVMFDIVKRVNC